MAKDWIENYIYYLLIFVISTLALIFFPMVGSTIGLGWNVPDTKAGWIVWIMTKLCVATINILIFHCFMQQAKINVRDNEHYKQANEILGRIKKKERIPRSPKKWNTIQYGKKGTTVFLFSILAVFAFTQAILSFDYIALATYLITIIMGIVFGILQMKTAEEYWTTEYYQYALHKQGEENNDNN